MSLYWTHSGTLIGNNKDWKTNLKTTICRPNATPPSNINYSKYVLICIISITYTLVLKPLSAVSKIQATTRPGGKFPQVAYITCTHYMYCTFI